MLLGTSQVGSTHPKMTLEAKHVCMQSTSEDETVSQTCMQCTSEDETGSQTGIQCTSEDETGSQTCMQCTSGDETGSHTCMQCTSEDETDVCSTTKCRRAVGYCCGSNGKPRKNQGFHKQQVIATMLWRMGCASPRRSPL